VKRTFEKVSNNFFNHLSSASNIKSTEVQFKVDHIEYFTILDSASIPIAVESFKKFSNLSALAIELEKELYICSETHTGEVLE
jgi:hypothetical protein